MLEYLNVKKAFSSGARLKVSAPTIISHNAPSSDFSSFLTIDGPLTPERQLLHPLVIQIQFDEDAVLVSENRYYIQASGSTVLEAIAEFKNVIVDEFNQLTHDEEQLGPRLQKQLQYLRSIIQ